MRAQLLWALTALLPLAAGASEPLGRHRPSIESVELLQQSTIPALAVGDFVVAPAAVGAATGVTFRFHTRVPSKGQSIASYLRAAIVTELAAAGKYDAAAATVITGELMESRLEGGTAALAARIRVTRSGRNTYDELWREESHWDSAVLGEVAIPDAFNQYTGLYGKLIMRLFQNEAFKTAIAP